MIKQLDVTFALTFDDILLVPQYSEIVPSMVTTKSFFARDIILHSPRKQGFSPPFFSWARGPWRGLVLDRLSSDRIEAAGVLDAPLVQRLLREHLEGREDRGRMLWTLLSLQAWSEQWWHGAASRHMVRESASPQDAALNAR